MGFQVGRARLHGTKGNIWESICRPSVISGQLRLLLYIITEITPITKTYKHNTDNTIALIAPALSPPLLMLGLFGEKTGAIGDGGG